MKPNFFGSVSFQLYLLGLGHQLPHGRMCLPAAPSPHRERSRTTKANQHSSRADRRFESIIVEACGAKPAYGYRRVAWWMERKQGLIMNGKRVLRMMRDRGLLVTPPVDAARRKKERVVSRRICRTKLWQTDMNKVQAGANVGWAISSA